MPFEDDIKTWLDLASLKRQTDEFISYTKEVEKQFAKLKAMTIEAVPGVKMKEVISQINTGTQAMNSFGESVKQVKVEEEKLTTAATKLSQSAVEQAHDMGILSGAYQELLAQSVANERATQTLVAQRKALTTAYRAGRITEKEYQAGLEEVKAAQIRLSQSNQQVNLALRNMEKEAASAAGSLNKLRAQLNLATQAFDHLSDVEKKAATGRELENKIKSLNATISGQEQTTGRFQRQVGAYGKALNGLTGIMGRLVAAGLALVGIHQIANFLSDTIDEFNQAEQAATRFKNVLDNVGRADVFERMKKQADDFAKSYKQLDNDDIINVFEKLVLFGKLTEDQISKLTPVIIDLAAKQGISLQEASDVIIKALEGNGRALKLYGIDIKDAKSETEAFGIIMDQLKPKVEGAAKTFGETTAGQIAITKQEINNLKEEIGGKLQPVLANFYRFISTALAGIPQFFDGLYNGIAKANNLLVNSFLVLKDIATFNFQGAWDRIDKANQEEKELQERGKLIAQDRNAQQQAESTANAAKEKSIAEQKRLLKSYQADLKDSEETYRRIIHAGKEATDEGRAAAARYHEDVKLVRELSISLEKQQDKRTVGGGKLGGGKPVPIKTNADAEKELRDQVEQLKKLSASEDLYLIDRVNARQQAYDLELTIGKKTGEDKKRLEEGLNLDLFIIRAKWNKQQADQTRATNEEARAQFKAQLDQRIRDAQSTNENIVLDIVRHQEKEVSALDKEFAKQFDKAKGNKQKQEKLEDDYGRRRAEIEAKYSGQIVEAQIKLAEVIIKIERDAGLNVADKEKALAELKIKYSDQVLAHIESNNNREIKSDEKRFAAIRKLVDNIKEVGDQVLGVVGSAIDASVTRQKNIIQGQIDLIDERRDKQIAAANAEALSEQDKEAKISRINLTAQVQKEALERRQRQLDQQRASWEKINAISQIILNTAVAIAKDIDVPWKIAFDAAIGAAQLAIAIATPIPKFGTGKKKNNSYQGLAEWGERGKSELRVRKDGSMEVSPPHSELTYVHRDDVIYDDARKAFAEMKIKNPVLATVQRNQPDNKNLEKGLRRIERAIENKTTARITNTWNGVSIGFENAQRYWQWVNRNTQS